MGAELQKESTSKFILNDKNFTRLAREVLEHSELEADEIVVKNVKVGEFVNKSNDETEPINMYTLILGA